MVQCRLDIPVRNSIQVTDHRDTRRRKCIIKAKAIRGSLAILPRRRIRCIRHSMASLRTDTMRPLIIRLNPNTLSTLNTLSTRNIHRTRNIRSIRPFQAILNTSHTLNIMRRTRSRCNSLRTPSNSK
jgi:hypothetical protein